MYFKEDMIIEETDHYLITHSPGNLNYMVIESPSIPGIVCTYIEEMYQKGYYLASIVPHAGFFIFRKSND